MMEQKLMLKIRL